MLWDVVRVLTRLLDRLGKALEENSTTCLSNDRVCQRLTCPNLVTAPNEVAGIFQSDVSEVPAAILTGPTGRACASQSAIGGAFTTCDRKQPEKRAFHDLDHGFWKVGALGDAQRRDVAGFGFWIAGGRRVTSFKGAPERPLDRAGLRGFPWLTLCRLIG
jgi:hypothetical protein